MEIILKADNKKEEKLLGFKKIGYKKVTDYYLDVRYIEGNIVKKEDSRSFGDILYLISRLYSALFQLKEYWRNRGE